MYKSYLDKSLHNLHLRVEKKEYELYIVKTFLHIKSHTDVDTKTLFTTHLELLLPKIYTD